MRVKAILPTYINIYHRRTVKFGKRLGDVAGTEATRNAYRILLVKPLRKMKTKKKSGAKTKMASSRTTALSWGEGWSA
jgi:hypothetical protein